MTRSLGSPRGSKIGSRQVSPARATAAPRSAAPHVRLGSLSVLLPVFNAESTLGEAVDPLLESLPDLAARFDVLLLVNGSTDTTAEVVHDLVSTYPQLRYVALNERATQAEVLRRGLSLTRGETVLFRSENCTLDLGQLHKMWQGHNGDLVTLARGSSKAPLGLIPRAPKSPAHAWTGPRPSLMLFARRLAEGWLADMAAQKRESDFIDFVIDKRIPFREVDLRERQARRGAPHFLAAAQQVAPRKGTRATGSAQRGPNYLTRLRDFALGE